MRRTILVSLLVVLSAPVFAQDELHLRRTNSLIQQVIRGERGEYPLSEYRPQEVQRSGEMVNQLTQDPLSTDVNSVRSSGTDNAISVSVGRLLERNAVLPTMELVCKNR